MQCVVRDTASKDKVLWHTEPRVMFKGEEEIKQVTQQGLNRANSKRSHKSKSDDIINACYSQKPRLTRVIVNQHHHSLYTDKHNDNDRLRISNRYDRADSSTHHRVV